MIHNLSLSTYLLTRADGWRPGPHLLACRCSFRCRPESPCRWRECWGPSVRCGQSPPSSWPPSPSQSPRSPPAGSPTCTWTGGCAGVIMRGKFTRKHMKVAWDSSVWSTWGVQGSPPSRASPAPPPPTLTALKYYFPYEVVRSFSIQKIILFLCFQLV